MSTLPSGYTPVDLPPSARAEVIGLDSWAFPASFDKDLVESWPMPIVWDRARGIRTDDGELVAMHASYPYQGFPIPGGHTAASGLTWVGVHPGHRRRRLLSAMIGEHFARSIARGETISGLYAAELAIYGRFGYGQAARSLKVSVPRGAALRDVPGAGKVRVRFATADADLHGAIVATLHDSIDRPGWAPRGTAEQHAAFLYDPPQWREGAEPMRIAIAERAGEPTGYALFRRKQEWPSVGPRGVVKVREVVTTDPATARAMWGVLLDLDLMASLEVGNLPADDALLHLLVDARAADPRLRDDLWIRVLDVPRALSERRYQAPIDLVIEVSDALVPANAGRWHLRGDMSRVEVTATSEPADLGLDVRELGAAYLGGMSLAAMANAGLVREFTPGAAHVAAAAFGWPVAPVSSWVW